MYNHKKIESKWAEKWVKDKTFTPDLEKAKDPYYALFMFPYPSAEGLHIGNFYAFTCVDVMAKYKKLQGKDVFEPIGFDAFGMHSENYALKIKETPKKMLNRTTANFRKQLKSAGLGCDWTREVDTTTPEYYKWTQWIFTKLFEKGLAYQKEALLNWCPSCKTVLADEQIENGICERCKSVPEKKTMKQWFLKITAYAQRLLDGLETMDWSGVTKHAQRNWIGRSEGAMIKFEVRSPEARKASSGSRLTRRDKKLEVKTNIEIFTTRPDTLFGATYFVMSPEHPLVKKITAPGQKKEVEQYIKKTGAKSDLERTEAKGKTGIFTGAYAINPVNNEKIPVWIADYVLMGYGTGAIMAVPAHDERDFEFAEKYNLPIKEVVIPIFGKKHKNEKYRETITALVHRKQDNKFLYLYNKHYKIVTPIIGGIKKHESIKDTAEREVYEETGYKVKFINKLGGQIESHFFASHKNVWRYRLDQPVLCELLDEDAKPDEISEEEKNKHKIIWLTAQEALKRIVYEDNKVGLLKYLGKYGVFCGEGRNINSDFPDKVLAKTKTPETGAFGGSKDSYPQCEIRTCHSVNSIAYNKKHVKSNNGAEPAEGLEPSNPEMTSSDSHHATGISTPSLLYQKNKNITKTLNDLTTKEAKKKIIKWLEARSIGKGTVNYKLRDWCISRQRYWGPPVPIVYCKKCAKNEKENVLILHGWEDSSKTGFIPSLKENLISKNYSVFAFDAPNTNEPDFDVWYKFIESKIKKNNLNKKIFNLVGHSIGGLIALKLAEKYKINKLILVSPVGSKSSKKYFKQFENELTKEEMKIFVNYQKRNLDIKKIKENAKEIIFVFGKKDKWITKEIRNFYIKNFKNTAAIHILENEGHMGEDEGVKKVEFIEDLFKKLTPGVHPVPEKDLPVKLPDLEQGWEPAGDGRGPLARVDKFIKTTCPKCKGPAEREADVMDNFLDSAWYFFRYISPRDDKNIFDKKLSKKWLPVDLYIGGNEHAVLHLMYTRFITMAFHDLGLINFDNPFKKFQANGMILKDGKKMSKSKGNVVNPEEYGEKIGYDALKIYILFLGPLSEDRSFSDSGAQGAKRWVEKIARLEQKVENNYKDSKNLIKKFHQTVKAVTDDFESQKYNTAIARLMELTNALSAEKNISNKIWKNFLILIAPFAPALAEELWAKLGNKKSIFKAKWPKHDPKLIKDDTINLVIQINGKLRDTIETPADISEDKAKKIALESEKIQKWIKGKEVIKMIFVKGKLVNIVIA